MASRAARLTARRQRTLGQYFTPQPVAAFALDALTALGLRPGRLRVVDPACGEGVWLREALARFPEAEAWGCDLDAGLAGAWRAGGLSEPRAHLVAQDGLADAPLFGLEAGTFDLVLGNPPYGYEVPRAQPGERIEVSFLRRFVALARPGGWLAAVLPEGIAANAQSQTLRDWVLERVALAAVVSLPEATFGAAGTHARTVLLLGRRGTGSFFAGKANAFGETSSREKGACPPMPCRKTGTGTFSAMTGRDEKEERGCGKGASPLFSAMTGRDEKEERGCGNGASPPLAALLAWPGAACKGRHAVGKYLASVLDALRSRASDVPAGRR